jgi:hypothetical protein
MAAPQQPRSVTVVMDLGFRSDPNLHRAQSGPLRVRIEARRRGWRQYNLWEMTAAGQIEPSSGAKESGKRNRVRDRNWRARNMGGGCAATCCMSFLRHQRSIVRWGHLHRGRNVSLLRPRLLTVSMSRSRLFLGGLHSCIARLRFAGCHQECYTAVTPVESFTGTRTAATSALTFMTFS